MAANMYRVGGMYTNVDLLSDKKPFSFASPGYYVALLSFVCL